MTNSIIRTTGVVGGATLIWWVIVWIRRGRIPTRAGVQRDYFLRRHDGIGFWLLAAFYASLGIAIIVASILNR